jgi:hypothetical protein
VAINYEFLNSFCEEVLARNKAINWAGIINQNGIILAQKSRPGNPVFLNEEENEEYAASVISRQKTRNKFESKIGKLVYAYGQYESLQRATIPINKDFYLLVTLNMEENDPNYIIMNQLIPLVQKNKSKFIASTY